MRSELPRAEFTEWLLAGSPRVDDRSRRAPRSGCSGCATGKSAPPADPDHAAAMRAALDAQAAEAKGTP